MRRLTAIAGLVFLVVGGLAATTRAQDIGVPAVIEPISPQVGFESHPTYDGSGNPLPATQWRVVSGTGNTAENYLAATADGRILDLGGAYLNYTDDLGETWHRVRPPVDFIGQSQEGAVTAAPGGDIVGLFWDPFSPDRAVSVKYDAATDTWLTSELVLKTPFFDRPWITAIPGPFSVGAIEVPYISVIFGGPSVKPFSYVSLDGLNYMTPSQATAEGTLGGTARWLEVAADPESDWIQPHSRSGITPLAGAGAIAPRYTSWPFRQTDEWVQLLPGELGWRGFEFPDGSRPQLGRYAIDSQGRVHRVDIRDGSMAYAISTDGGRTWASTQVELPEGHSAQQWDFKANGALGITAIAVHAQRADTDLDLVYRFATSSNEPVIEKIYELGAGDLDTFDFLDAGNLNAPRFDFSNILILPDGRLATSFVDSNHLPSLAIEMAATTPTPTPTESSPPPSPTPTPSDPDPTPTPDPCPTTTPSPSESPTPSESPEPTPTEPDPTPTEPTGTSTRYFFHSVTGAHLIDELIGVASFDDSEPTRDVPAIVTDPLTEYDANAKTLTERLWTGQITQPFDRLTIDFWADGSDGLGHSGTKYYRVWLRTSTGTLNLGSFSTEETTPGVPDRITHAFETYFDPDGNEVPLNVNSSDPISVTIGQPNSGDGIILYDSKTFPSGFTVSSGDTSATNDTAGAQNSGGAQVSIDAGECGTGADQTSLTFTTGSAAAAQYTDGASFVARLTDSTGNPVADAQLDFELTGDDGSEAWSAPTDQNGVASRDVAVNRAPGTYFLTVTYAGDERHTRTADSTFFVVEREDTEMSLDAQGRGSQRLLIAELHDPDGAAVAGRDIAFYVGDKLIGTATTNDVGLAIFNPPSRYQGGHRDYEALFEGDDFFIASRGRTST